MGEIEIVIRPAALEDKELILSSWLQGQYYSSPDYFQLMPKEIYFAAYAWVIKSILFTPSVQVNVATDKNNPLWTAGFCVFKGDSVYWIYVKKDFRGRGIAKLMLPQSPITTAKVLTNEKALTKAGKAIVKNKGLIVSPF